MSALIVALMLGPFDAARGGQYIPRVRASIGSLAYAFAVAWLLVGLHWTLPLVAAAFMLGEGLGWGCPLGSALRGQPMDATSCRSGLERWQVGIFARNAWAALAARGTLWGLPLALLGLVLPDTHLLIMPAVMAIAMVAAPALVRAANGWRPSDHLWSLQEWLRGWLVGLALAAGSIPVPLWSTLGGSLAGAYATWVFYLAVMTLIRARKAGTLPPVALAVAYPVVAVGLLFDFALHIVVGTVLFWERPREWLLTQRLSRLIKTDYGWRGDLAMWMCSTLLDAFDPAGRHCAERANAVSRLPTTLNAAPARE